jgi:hypothetical protein
LIDYEKKFSEGIDDSKIQSINSLKAKLSDENQNITLGELEKRALLNDAKHFLRSYSLNPKQLKTSQ